MNFTYYEGQIGITFLNNLDSVKTISQLAKAFILISFLHPTV